MNKTLKSLLALFAIGMLVLATACNTVDGAGKDIEATGEAIQGD
ncbi:MAG: entericidin A/B family lipoprotein [Phycisphaerales bacterium]